MVERIERRNWECDFNGKKMQDRRHLSFRTPRYEGACQGLEADESSGMKGHFVIWEAY